MVRIDRSGSGRALTECRLKQMRLIHHKGYTPDEVEDFRSVPLVLTHMPEVLSRPCEYAVQN